MRPQPPRNLSRATFVRCDFEARAEFHGGSGDPLGRSKFRPSLVSIDSVLSKIASWATLLCVKYCPYLYDILDHFEQHLLLSLLIRQKVGT